MKLYKGHRIQVLVGLDGLSWVTNLQILCRIGLAHMLVVFGINERFATYDRAMRAGITAAQNWVDEFGYGSKTAKLRARSRLLHEQCRTTQQTSRTILAETLKLLEERSALRLQMRPAISASVVSP